MQHRHTDNMACCCIPLFRRKRESVDRLLIKYPVIANVYSKLPVIPVKKVENFQNLQNTKYFRALCDCTGGDINLSFEYNDVIEVEINLEDRSKCRARNVMSGIRGYVNLEDLQAILELEPWYFGKIKREEAETLLLEENNEPGTFLVRQSTSCYQYILSIKTSEGQESVVKHYKIINDSNGFYISHGLFCPTLDNLINLYLSDTRNQMALCQRLIKSCVKPTTNYFN